jgi:hypothetical protein
MLIADCWVILDFGLGRDSAIAEGIFYLEVLNDYPID